MIAKVSLVRLAPAAALALVLASSGCSPAPPAVAVLTPAGTAAHPFLAPGVTPVDIERRVAQFAPAVLDFDATPLEGWERAVLARLVEASDVLHEIFMEQVSPRNREWRHRLEAGSGAGGDAARRYFDINVGPWDRLADHAPFLDVGPKPPGAGFYPQDLTAAELEAWLGRNPGRAESARSYFTVIRRTPAGELAVVPYPDAYRARLEQAAALLRDAADLSRNASLSRFLRLRADAFLSNDYFASDMAWMDLDSRIEATIGPYEVYEDRLMGWKAAFTSFITVADPQLTGELERLAGRMRHLEEMLPIEDRYKNLDRGFESPIRVADAAYTAGDTRAGVQTIAFNLPNDERVREAKGSKQVMLRNVMRAKFDQILVPISRQVLAPDLVGRLDFQAWFVNVLMHELAHGIGPGFITTPAGERMTVNQALREHYSAMEEAKADVAGLHSLTVLAAEGFYGDDFVRRAFLGNVANIFRATRFGTTAAHGRANLVQFNWHWERGAVRVDPASGRFTADIDALIASNRELATRLLTIQARGDYDEAGRFLAQYGQVRPELRAALDRLGDVPVDIRPEYTVKQKMARW
jgi:hypothetical protein